MNTALRNPVLQGLRADLAAEIGVRHSTPVTDRLLDILTVVVARAYTVICRGDSHNEILGRAVTALWRAAEKICCQEARTAARVVTQPALSIETKTAAGIELAGFVMETLKISTGAIPRSIRNTSSPAELARVDHYDYLIGAIEELLSERWDRPGIISPYTYIRSALMSEAHRYYIANLREQRLHTSIEPLLCGPSCVNSSPDQVVPPVDLERGLTILRAGGLPEDVAMLVAERYLRYHRPNDVGMDVEIATVLGWSPKRLDRAQAAMRRSWGTRMEQWFRAYRPTAPSDSWKKFSSQRENRVGGKPKESPLVDRGENRWTMSK